MSLRQREFTLENLEQRMLLSADGLIGDGIEAFENPLAPVLTAEIVTDQAQPDEADAPAVPADESLVDTTASVATETTATAVETTPETVSTGSTGPVENDSLPPAPEVPSAADFSVLTLTAGNGPPQSDSSQNDSGNGGKEVIDPWDPPFGGFNFTATHADIPTRTAQYDALKALLATGTGSTVTMEGTMVKRATGGEYPLGELTITGTLKFERHLDEATPAVDSAGRFVFRVWFDTASTVSFKVGGVELSLIASKGAFLVSGKYTNIGDGVEAEYDLGGGAGSVVITGINLIGVGDDLFGFDDLTNVVLTVNTAAGLANGAQTTAADIGGTGLGATFGATNSIGLTGQVSISVTSVGLTLVGDVGFTVIDTNGGDPGGYALQIGLTNGTLSLGTGIKLTATGVTTTFTVYNNGLVASVSVANLGLTGLTGVTVTSASASFSVDTRPTTPVVTVTASTTVAVNLAGFTADLTGSFTFTRDGSGIVFGIENGGASVAAAGVTLTLSDFDGGFAIRSDGFVGKATVDAEIDGLPGATLTATGLTFEINTINNAGDLDLILPVVGAVSYNTADRKKFFRIQGDLTLGLDFGGIEVELDGTFYFEQYDPDGAGSAPTVFKFATVNASASFTAGAGGDAIEIGVTGVTGGFLITDAGIAGYLDATGITVTTPGDILTVAGTDFSFNINTTGDEVVADFDIVGSGTPVSLNYTAADQKEFVSVAGTFTQFDVNLGSVVFKTTGSFAFYAGTITDPGDPDVKTEVVKVGFAGVDASLTIGGITASIKGIEGIIVLVGGDAAGRIEFDELSIQGVTGFTLTIGLTDSFAFEFNTTGLKIDEALSVGGVSRTLSYTADEELNFFRGSGTASLAFTNGGFSTTLTGTFGFESFTLPDTTSVVKFAFIDVSFEIAVGDAKLVVNDADGFFIFGENSEGDASYAGRLSISNAELVGVSGLTLSVTNFNLEVNTFGEAVTASITRPSLPDFTLAFSAADKHDFISIGGTLNLIVALGGFEFTLSGSFYFESTTVTVNEDEVVNTLRVAVSGGSFSLNIGGVALNASGIRGGFLIKEDGTVAMQMSIGEVSLTGIDGFTFSVTNFFLKLNNTGDAVTENFVFPDGDDLDDDPDVVALDFEGDAFSLGGTVDLGIAFGGFETTLT
ncbi:MAG TPA: LEPR-XLL domain-containing protein, partial [Opitutaceae bacterium]|nr:LEPR-XLL domain-containing protein [Opitutaceae bacterium]